MGQITSLSGSLSTHKKISPLLEFSETRQHQDPSTHLVALWVFPRAISTLTVSYPLLALEVNVSGAEAIIS